MMKKVFLTLCLVISGTAHSALITYNGYTLDTDTNIVTGGGLEWLRWDQTQGKSINAAITQYTAAGWKLASNTQMAELFRAFTFNTTLMDNTYVGTSGRYVSGSDISIYDNFIALFADTSRLPPEYYGTGTDSLQFAAALYGSDEDSDGLYKDAHVQSDYVYQNGRPYDPVALLRTDMSASTRINPSAGVALVRTASVPEPSTIAIFALGMLGLGMRSKVRA